MTSTATNSPQRYEITDEDLSCLWDYITSAVNGDEEDETIFRLVQQEYSVIRSRPIPTAPETSDETISVLISENARIGAELSHMIERVKMLSGEHDAAIAAAARKDEREKVLDKLGTMLNSRIAKMEILNSNNPSPFRMGIIEGYRDIERWERSSRNHKEEP